MKIVDDLIFECSCESKTEDSSALKKALVGYRLQKFLWFEVVLEDDLNLNLSCATEVVCILNSIYNSMVQVSFG